MGRARVRQRERNRARGALADPPASRLCGGCGVCSDGVAAALGLKNSPATAATATIANRVRDMVIMGFACGIEWWV